MKNFKFRVLTIIFASLFITPSIARAADENEAIGRILEGSYVTRMRDTYSEIINDSCSCHRLTEARIVKAKESNSALTDTQLAADIESLNNSCRVEVMNTVKSVSEQNSVKRAFRNSAGERPFRKLKRKSLRELGNNSRQLTLSNTNITTKIICTDDMAEALENEVETGTILSASSRECFAIENNDQRRECLFQARTPLVGAVDRTVPGLSFVSNPADVQQIVGESNPVDILLMQEINGQKQLINRIIESKCQCDYVQTHSQVLECVNIIRENSNNWQESLTTGADLNFDEENEFVGSLVCTDQDVAAFDGSSNALDDDYLLNCLKGNDTAACKSKLKKRLGQLYCFNNNVDACVDGLKEVVLDYNHRKIEDPCRAEEYANDSNKRSECLEIASYQFLLNNHSANFFQALCPIDWSGCDKTGEDKLCRPELYPEYECKKRLVTQMLSLDDQLFKSSTVAGFMRGLTATSIAEDCEVTVDDVTTPNNASKFKSDKSNDACLLQKFAVENNMNHIDMDIITYCKAETLKKAELRPEQYSAKDHLSEIVQCYYQKNIYIADEELMNRVKDKYCKPELYTSKECGWSDGSGNISAAKKLSCEKECMNRLVTRTFQEVDPECIANYSNPMEQKLCALEKNLTTLAENSFPVTSCFNEKAFPNREDRRNCQDVAAKLDEAVAQCLQDNEFPLDCIDKLMKESDPMAFHSECSDDDQKSGSCFSILNEYINSLLAWNGLEAPAGQCTAQGYADDQRGHLECEMMVLSQNNFNNSNAFIDRQFYCQTNEAAAQSEECANFTTPYVSQSSVSGLSRIGNEPIPGLNGNDNPSPAPVVAGTNGSTGGNGATGAIVGGAAGIAGISGQDYSRSPSVTVDGNQVDLRSSLLSGSKGNGFFGFVKDFKYLKFMRHENAQCKALGRAAMVRVAGTVGGALTVYMVHKKVMDNYEKEQKEQLNQSDDPNNTALRNEQNVQITAMDHVKQGYKGALAGAGVKIGMNLIAGAITRNAVATERERMRQAAAAGQPYQPTVCRSEDIPSRSERRSARRARREEQAALDLVLPSEKRERYYMNSLEKAQTDYELRMIFDDYNDFSTGRRVASLSEQEYRQQEFEYMLDSIYMPNDNSAIDAIKGSFQTLVSTTSNLILPKAHAEMQMGQIMMFMPLIMPLLSNMGKKDEPTRNNTSSRTANNSPAPNNQQVDEDGNPITGDGDNVDVITAGEEILANDDSEQLEGVQGDLTQQICALDVARCRLNGGSNCGCTQEEPTVPEVNTGDIGEPNEDA